MGEGSTLQKGEKKQYQKRGATTAKQEREARKHHITEHHGRSLIILCYLFVIIAIKLYSFYQKNCKDIVQPMLSQEEDVRRNQTI